jgi:hypothetical protein
VVTMAQQMRERDHGFAPQTGQKSFITSGPNVTTLNSA